jgi:nucleoside-diphosphate-sugar epimerase
MLSSKGKKVGEADRVFITGSTGYIGSRLVPLLLGKGHEVRALVRAQSRKRLPAGYLPVEGDARVSHPSPSKAQEFAALDGPAALQAIQVAREAGVRHFIYLSMASDAVRSGSSGERTQRHGGASLVRPGPGSPLALRVGSAVQGC